MTYWVERRDNGGTWYRYTSNNSEVAADYSADGIKRQFPNSQIRVVDDRGSVRSVSVIS